jgi:hypothetical protein
VDAAIDRVVLESLDERAPRANIDIRTGNAFSHLVVSDGRYDVNMMPLDSIEVFNASLGKVVPDARIPTATIHGICEFPDITFGKCRVTQDAEIYAASANIKVEEYLSDDGLVHLRGHSHYVQRAAAGTTFIVNGSCFLVLEHSETLKQITFSGNARVILEGRHEGHVFLSSATQPIDLTLRPASILLDADGCIRSLTADDAVCGGNATEPLVVEVLSSVKDAQLENVDIFRLGVQYLLKLKEAQRLVPAFPSSHEELSKRADAMTADGGPITPSQSVFYWRELTAILKACHAPGATQAAARFQSHRARLRANPKSPAERRLLQWFQFVGFGEKIRRPLVLYVLVAMIFAGMYSLNFWSRGILGEDKEYVSILWHNILQMLVAPLGIFHATDAGQLPQAGTLQLLTVDGFRILGTILLTLTAAASRRLLRAE